jgi:4-oxalomesaconate tautomerase
MQDSIPCSLYRGGTSKGLYFHASDLPADLASRDRLLLEVMGSPDERQIDGLGGAHPLTSKVAVIGPPTRDDVDIDYLFLQIVVDKAEVRDTQNCGNILAGVGPFAIEEGLVEAADDVTSVRIHMVNSGSVATARVQTPAGRVRYDGDARIDGVPGTAAPLMLDFEDVEGANCGALLPTGNANDTVNGVSITCIDNGMPVVLLSAADFGLTGSESPVWIESNAEATQRIEAIRLVVGPLMNLGDVSDKTVPKMCLVSPAGNGGAISTRTLIPHRVHDSIGVLGAASVAAACLIPGSVAHRVSGSTTQSGSHSIDIEHPTGFLTVAMEVTMDGGTARFGRTGLLRTARRLMRGEVFFEADGRQEARR